MDPVFETQTVKLLPLL